jgi:hypothetical protein
MGKGFLPERMETKPSRLKIRSFLPFLSRNLSIHFWTWTANNGAIIIATTKTQSLGSILLPPVFNVSSSYLPAEAN